MENFRTDQDEDPALIVTTRVAQKFRNSAWIIANIFGLSQSHQKFQFPVCHRRQVTPLYTENN